MTTPRLHVFAFRLKDDATYIQRYSSLITAVEATTQSRWDEATAVYVMLFNGTSEQLLVHLRANSRVYDDGRDLLVAMEVDVKDIAGIGAEKISALRFIAGLAGGQTLGGLFALGASARTNRPNTLGSR